MRRWPLRALLACARPTDSPAPASWRSKGASPSAALTVPASAGLQRISSELLLASRENSDYNVGQLRGVRLAITSETGQHRRLDEARVKLLTGGDTLPARHPYGRPFTFAPTHHVWLSSNHKPEIQGQDNGIWSRVKLIEFPNRFELPPGARLGGHHWSVSPRASD